MIRREFIQKASLAAGALASGLPLQAEGNPRFATGIDVLAASGFRALKGKRFGLLTHPAGVNRRGESTIEVLRRSPAGRLVALFGPEHGIYGDEKANIPVDDKIDRRTGLPVYSLYGKYRRPTEKMLRGLDAIAIDLQDLGTRSYTYISCMKYVLEACFEAGIEVIILDRPNPLGGLKIDGPSLDPEWTSYVGAWPVPYVYGLTIGELAQWGKSAPGILDVANSSRRRGKLTVIQMRGWQRHMLWTATGLDWVPTSPAIPNLSAAMGYPMTGLGTQLGGFRHGYGTRYPFRLLQYSGRSPETIARTLAARKIRGLDYRIVHFQDRGQDHRGAYVLVDDWNALRPTELSFHMMLIACAWSRENPFRTAPESRQGLFNKHVGDGSWLRALQNMGSRADLDGYLRKWRSETEKYEARIRNFRLYS